MGYINVDYPCTADYLRERLCSNTDTQKSFKYLRWIERATGKRYYGIINHLGFQLVPYVVGKNFFTPVVQGNIVDKAYGCTLQYKWKNSPVIQALYTTALVVVCFLLLCNLGIVCGFVESHLFNNPETIVWDWIMIVVFAILMVVFFLMNSTSKRRIISRYGGPFFRRQGDGSSVLTKPQKGDDISKNREKSE